MSASGPKIKPNKNVIQPFFKEKLTNVIVCESKHLYVSLCFNSRTLRHSSRLPSFHLCNGSRSSLCRKDSFLLRAGR